MYFILTLLIGFTAGKMLAFPVLIGVTVVCIVIGIYMAKTYNEAARLLTMIFILYAAIGNGMMWVTFYVTTNQSWFGTFLNTYIFR